METKIRAGKGNTRIFDTYCDGGHSWTKVPRKLLQALEIEEKISPSSYQRGDFVFLEEDCDFSKFYDALGRLDINIRLRTHHSKKSSKIRSYESFVVKKS